MTATTTGPRADLQAYEESMRLSSADLVGRLRESLRAKLVAYLGSVTETRAVRQWAEGTRAPSNEVVNRLRTAYQTTALLRQKDTALVRGDQHRPDPSHEGPECRCLSHQLFHVVPRPRAPRGRRLLQRTACEALTWGDAGSG